MALQTSGQISLNDIQGEFGGSNPIEIDEYYRGGSLVPDIPANSSVPTSGTIALSNFYGAVNGVEITINLIGGGGGGGFGFRDGGNDATTSSGSGGESRIEFSDGTILATAAGGAGGGDGQGAEGGQGGDGGASPLNGIVASGGFVNQPGNDAGVANAGGGGGGGGGDESSKGDVAGFAGEGGAAGLQTTGTYVVFGTLQIYLGGGGIAGSDNFRYDGGDGAPGYCSIQSTQAVGGNAFYQDVTTRAATGPYSYIATLPAGSFSLTISSNVENLDLRTAAVNAGWDESGPLFVTISSGVYLWSNSITIGGIEISGTYPNGLFIENDGYVMGRGGNGGGGTGGPAIKITSNNQNISITNNPSGYIGGGGGGGAGSGGGGGVGGGRGGPHATYGGSASSSPGAGGAIGQSGGNGTGVGGNGGTGGGGGGDGYDTGSRNFGVYAGGGGGRVFPGVGGAAGTSPGGFGSRGGGGAGGSNNNPGGNRLGGNAGGGGGGWGARGGSSGGFGGAAVDDAGTGNSVSVGGPNVWGAVP